MATEVQDLLKGLGFSRYVGFRAFRVYDVYRVYGFAVASRIFAEEIADVRRSTPEVYTIHVPGAQKTTMPGRA